MNSWILLVTFFTIIGLVIVLLFDNKRGMLEPIKNTPSKPADKTYKVILRNNQVLCSKKSERCENFSPDTSILNTTSIASPDLASPDLASPDLASLGPCCTSHLYEILEAISKECIALQIPFWLQGGIAIYPPHTLEDDLNIGFVPKKTPEIGVPKSTALSPLLELLKNRGFDPILKDGILTVHLSKTNRICIDIVPSENPPGKRYVQRMFDDDLVMIVAPGTGRIVFCLDPKKRPSDPLRKHVNPARIDPEMPVCLIVTSDEFPERWHHVVLECEAVGCQAIPIRAVTPKTIKEESEGIFGRTMTMEEVRNNPNIVSSKFHTLRNGQICCYLSHIKAWKYIRERYKTTLGLYLILEDDIFFHDDFVPIYKSRVLPVVRNDFLLTPKEQIDILFFGGMVVEEEQFFPTKHMFYYKTGFTTGMWAYMPNPKRVGYLLEKVFPLNFPIDLTVTASRDYFSTHKRDFRYNLNNYAIHNGSPLGGKTMLTIRRFGPIGELSSTSWGHNLSGL